MVFAYHPGTFPVTQQAPDHGHELERQDHDYYFDYGKQHFDHVASDARNEERHPLVELHCFRLKLRPGMLVHVDGLGGLARFLHGRLVGRVGF